MSYEYKSPIDKGYNKFFLSTKQHNELFPNRKKKWANKFEYYISENSIVIHKFTSLKMKVFTVALFPIVVILSGLRNLNEVKREYLKMFNEKNSGSFSSDYVDAKSETYSKVKNLL